jgi:hypothetical protein
MGYHKSCNLIGYATRGLSVIAHGCEKRRFESRFVDVSVEFLNELLDNSIPKTRWILKQLDYSLEDLLIDYQP